MVRMEYRKGPSLDHFHSVMINKIIEILHWNVWLYADNLNNISSKDASVLRQNLLHIDW